MKQTNLGKIEVNADGTIGLLLLLQYVDGDEIVASNNHRVMLTPDQDYNATLASVDLHLAEMGYPAISNDDKQRVQDIAQAVWN